LFLQGVFIRGGHLIPIILSAADPNVLNGRNIAMFACYRELLSSLSPDEKFANLSRG
jgi:hypothetical protein